ncbi:sugar ABC transporter substrate-binding protein [Butyrivibrio sp. CB08]|uniref:sugar ABC transporter substrate-binding protein n=1 Tax=Butyrivibrio sp. CB08 TaxID=2364879 RepID=UPI000EA8B531|nr:substrate-binding domain-containing protein [Butyrivibrio sp. CB08]RKM58791.1 sugar ABC transporter substrate-binding protein [Butyrivibrio sp. CB08]
MGKIVRKRGISFILALVLCVLSLTACGGEGADSSKKDKEDDDKISIGMCFDSFVIERWQRDRDVFVSTAKELGAEVNIQNANGDPMQQKQQIEYFIKSGMDVIVIICIDSTAIAESVKKAQDAGIKVIAYDRPIKDAGVDLYISFDNEKVGQMMGEAIVKRDVKNGKVLMICGSLTDFNVPMVENGFKKVMRQNRNEIIDTFYADGWKAEEAGNYIINNMDKVVMADAIMCGNDDLATRVVHALAEKRLAGKILVVGQDADLEACQRIVEGTQLMTVYKPIEKLAQRAAQASVLLALGQGVEDPNLSQYDDGSEMVPYLKIDPVSVNESNINEVIIKSGFHLKEDVYLNVPGKMPSN